MQKNLSYYEICFFWLKILKLLDGINDVKRKFRRIGDKY